MQILGNKIRLSDSSVNIVTTGEVKTVRSKCYTVAEIRNGTYDSERSSQISYASATEIYCNFPNIVYDFGNSLAAGIHNVNGTISLRWSKAAHDVDGNEYDVKMYIDNIRVANADRATRPISLMADSEHAIRPAVQEIPGSEILENYSTYGSYDIYNFHVGATYDVEISVVQPGTNTPVTGKKTVYQMEDLDQPDHYTNDSGYGDFVDGSGGPMPFSEGVTLISGIDQNVFVGSDSLLNITNTHYGNNTRFSGTRATGSNEQERSSIAFRGDISGFKYTWYGSNCATSFGWIGAKKVTTSTSGNYANKGTITETDTEVLWKEDKKIVATPSRGYYVSKVTVDGRDVTFTPDADGKVTYTFPDVIADHAIDVQFAPYHYKVTVHHYRVGTTEKVAPDVVEEDHTTGEQYTSEAASPEGYHLVEKPTAETVTFVDKDIELIYYYGKNYKVTVHHYKVGTTDPVAPDVVEDNHVAGDSYTSKEVNVDGYELVEKPKEETVTFKDEDIELIYYYAEKGTIVVEYCDADTKRCNLAPSVTDEGIDGEESKVCVEKKIDGYSFINREGDACVYDKDTANIKYWYKKAQNPNTADINLGYHIAAIAGLAVTAAGSLLFALKKRR